MKDAIYYECHITLPIHALQHKTLLEELCVRNSFKLGDLYLIKDPGKVSDKDVFMTARYNNKAGIYMMMINMITDLKANGIDIIRYKIEAVILDSRRDDYFGFIN